MDLGRRFVPGDLVRGFARTVGRTSRLSVAVRAWQLRSTAAAPGSRTNRLVTRLRELGPYTAIALLLPGGSLIALAAWTFRRRPPITVPLGRLSLVVAAFGAALILPGNI
jgi:hypothetical protein